MTAYIKQKRTYIFVAILAAVLYGISAPFCKLLLEKLSPTFLAAMLYLGAGIGMLFVIAFRAAAKKERAEARIAKRELPYVVGTVVLDIAAPILLMLGISRTTSASASLLNNFEIAATSVIALIIFKEAVGKRMWGAIILITLASFVLSVKDFGSFTFSIGSVYVLLACVCWGFENNFTRKLSLKDPLQIVVIKGIASGAGALIVCAILRQITFDFVYVIYAALLGFVAFGLSIYFYIKAQRHLGAARTSAYYAAAPFVGVIVSFIALRETVYWTFFAALVMMIAGVILVISEKHGHAHVHGTAVHTHTHSHDDGHHNHEFDGDDTSAHSHAHEHEPQQHAHEHHPDEHHRHEHK